MRRGDSSVRAVAALIRMVGRIVRRTMLLLVASLVVVEAALQLAALFAPYRDAVVRDAVHRVLCVGDSHTYGALVAAEESYPAQLQRLLDERAPGSYAVVNQGVPGFNSTLVRERLHAALERYHPETVIVWCGVNNSWNATGVAADSWRGRVDAWATGHIRLWRLWRTWRNDRAIHEELARAGRRQEIVEQRRSDGKVASVKLGDDSRWAPIEFSFGTTADDEAADGRLLADYQAMIDDTRAAGARIIFVMYPVDEGQFTVPDRVLRRLFRETGVPLVDSARALARVDPESQKLLWGGHPKGAVYGEIARDLAPLVQVPVAVREPGLITRLDFATSALPPEAIVTGDCPPSAPCGERSCYRWHPEHGRCHVQADLPILSPDVRVVAHFRLTGPVDGLPFDFVSALEPRFGSGLFVQLVPPDRIRLLARGHGDQVCGPLPRPLEAGVTYEVRMLAEKGMHAAASLDLLDGDGRVLDTLRCSDLQTGGGRFERVRVGSNNPNVAGTIEFDGAAVYAETEGRR
jgi:hypothetical protein